MNRRVVLVVPFVGIMILVLYTRNQFNVVGPKAAVFEDTGTKSNVVHMSQKIIQMPTKPALIPKKDVRFGKLATTKKPMKKKIQPVMETDWLALEEMPTHKQPENILRSDWWRASAFVEIDFRKRPKDYKCRNMKNVGNWYLCQDKPYNLHQPCLVYSFGIANDFSFDDAMAKLGCEVHSFDPSMNETAHVRNSSVTFHPIGLSNRVIKNFNPRHDIYVTNDQTWNMMDLLSIMDKLGHKNRDLDYLKIDVEGHEWSVIDYLLQTGITSRIRHFSLEYHIFPDWPAKALYPNLLQTYKRLKEAGFYKYFTGLHPLDHRPKHFNIQADVCYVNIKYK